jgi:hypothetical protein
MYAAYHLRADELNSDVIQTLKDTYDQRGRIKALDEGKGIVKTMAELEAITNNVSPPWIGIYPSKFWGSNSI